MMDEELRLLRERALGWADDDCDPETAAQCRQLVLGANLDELRDHFAGKLEFGTAGLRAKVGPGPWRMNRGTVRRATRAVADYLISNDGGKTAVEVVVAFDARASSRTLAEEVCGTLTGAGVRVRVFTEPTPTPVAAFALLHLGASAAIVITASHNPKEYNGFKLYGADGAQIVAPADSDIATRMDNLGPAHQIPRAAYDISASHLDALGDEIGDAYLAALGRLSALPQGDVSQPRRVCIAYTPLHGLGAAWVTRALGAAGFEHLDVVEAQRAPHPEFPTVPFPNPEEPAVMNAVFALAEAGGADVALANDPDVDRLAVGLAGPDGKFSALSGNQVGMLLAEFLLRRHGVSAAGAKPLVVQSIVSSPMLEQIAAAHGAVWERTLTGFKWISRPAIALPHLRFVMGFEEAIGYSVLPEVRDKDGISAALVVAELVDNCECNGITLGQALFTLYQRYGLWVSAQHSVTLPGAAGAGRIREAMQSLRAAPPAELLGQPVTQVTDYAVGETERPPWLGKANLVELRLGQAGRVLVRPSGTEPKLKIYVDACGEAPARWEQLRPAEEYREKQARELGIALAEYLGL